MANPRIEALLCLATFVTASACSGPKAADQQRVETSGNSVQAEASILVGSTPAPGSTVSVPVDMLVLRFSPPASLAEVTVTGPEGTMPMMLSPAGEQASYSLPLPGLTGGSYTVSWRANAGGKAHRGAFTFVVR
jgi:methionine-rich copper-binding protein CopC